MNSFDEFSKALYVAKTCMEVRFCDLKKRRNEMINLINRGRVVVPGSFECVDRYDKELCDLASSIIAIYIWIFPRCVMRNIWNIFQIRLNDIDAFKRMLL